MASKLTKVISLCKLHLLLYVYSEIRYMKHHFRRLLFQAILTIENTPWKISHSVFSFLCIQVESLPYSLMYCTVFQLC